MSEPNNIKTSPSPNEWGFHARGLEDQLEEQIATDNESLKKKRTAMAKRANTAGELVVTGYGARTAARLHSQIPNSKLNNFEQPKKM
mmetsp:Transcript_21729/g.33527  ORF Transcript_21729/g.33527 Transcript_21729/m.33527 type:complete len:87 (+) Transcript_21729:6643-6903(+)